MSIRLLVNFFAQINNKKQDKQAFRDKLLDEIHGLPVYVITQPITCRIFVALSEE